MSCYHIELETAADCIVRLPIILALQEIQTLRKWFVLQNSQHVDLPLQPLMAVARIALEVERNSELRLPISVSQKRADIAATIPDRIGAIYALPKSGLGEVVFDSRG